MDTTLYYVHDPMCSWCWGFSPTWDAIRMALPAEQKVVELLGGLAPDTDEPMPEQMRDYLQQTWRTIQSQLGTPFNFDFWQQCQPRRATYPACRAVIAAEQQEAGELMVQAIQHAYYLRAMNPSEDAVLTTLATELGLNSERFARDLVDPATSVELHHQITLARQLGVESFPSLIYVTDHGGPRRIQHDYLDPQRTLDQLYGVESSEL
jgi:putative protein-disulfide isomerase